jgi:hypothetical protein
MSEKVMVVCSYCGEKHGIEVWNRINVGENPDLKAKVKDGSLFVWECPHCGKANLARYQTLYHDPDSRLMVWAMPDGILSEEQEKALESHMEAISQALDGYTLRRVADTGTLIEKVNIFDAGLDDCVIEMCKHITKMEMAGKGGSKDILSAQFKFYRVDGADNDIEFYYPSDGQMLGLKIGFNVYEDCAGIIHRNPSVKPDAGFARVDPDWVSRFFR